MMTNPAHGHMFNVPFSIDQIEKIILRDIDNYIVAFFYSGCYGQSRGKIDVFLEKVKRVPNMTNTQLDYIFRSVNKDELEEYLKYYYVIYYHSLAMDIDGMTVKVPDTYKFLHRCLDNTCKEILLHGMGWMKVKDHQWVQTLKALVTRAVEKAFRDCAKLKDLVSKNLTILSTPKAVPVSLKETEKEEYESESSEYESEPEEAASALSANTPSPFEAVMEDAPAPDTDDDPMARIMSSMSPKSGDLPPPPSMPEEIRTVFA